MQTTLMTTSELLNLDRLTGIALDRARACPQRTGDG